MQELHTIGWNTILKPDRIAKDSGLRESRRIVGQAKLIVEKYAQKSEVMLEGLDTEISALPISEELRQSTLRGFRDGMAKNNNLGGRWALETQIVLQVQSIFAFLDATRAWEVKGGKILFARQEDLDRYTSYLEAIDHLRKQGTDMRNEAIQTTTSKLDALQQDLSR